MCGRGILYQWRGGGGVEGVNIILLLLAIFVGVEEAACWCGLV